MCAVQYVWAVFASGSGRYSYSALEAVWAAGLAYKSMISNLRMRCHKPTENFWVAVASILLLFNEGIFTVSLKDRFTIIQAYPGTIKVFGPNEH